MYRQHTRNFPDFLLLRSYVPESMINESALLDSFREVFCTLKRSKERPEGHFPMQNFLYNNSIII